MRNIVISFIILLAIAACKGPGPSSRATIALPLPVKDTTPRVIGIGGVFFESNDPSIMKEWYTTRLGLKMDEHGAVFETRNADKPDEKNYARWSVFEKGNNYFSPGNRSFMINYRVNNLQALVRNLSKRGVVFTDSIRETRYGSFIHLLDVDGNKLELWEPIDSVLSRLEISTNH